MPAAPPPGPPPGYGWTPGLEAAFAPFAARGLVPGRISRVDLGRCEVVVAGAAGPVTVHAGIRSRRDVPDQEHPCTGDWVALGTGPGGTLPVVAEVLPRVTAIVRRRADRTSQGQVLAANVDAVLIAVAVTGEIDLGRVERFLALAWESGAEPVVVLTKADMPHDPGVTGTVGAVAPGADVLAVSAVTGAGMAALRDRLPFTTALVGLSGAGKSTLVNALAGAPVMAVNAVRDADGKGRHTTTARELVPWPGGVLVDTPGLRSVGLPGGTGDGDGGDGVGQAFSDVEDLAAGCRFGDCAHDAEPGCAVREAVAAGTLQPRRLASYRKLVREQEWIAARTDARLARERVRRWKAAVRSAGPSRP